ncbi:MAG: DUF5916 domain-containing protein [Saprospiraceae bacterium]|nr:carbohydrate binding family 9 domain-containing protein [Lewinella sp.]
MNRYWLLLLLVCCFPFVKTAFANEDRPIPHMFVGRTDQPLVIDGDLNEEVWMKSQPAKDFWSNFPTDTALAPVQTEIYMVFDDQYLYIGAKCYSVGRDYVIPSLRRDYRAGGNDNITFLFDPFSDRTNAFVFGMNPYGVRREALISNGGRVREDFDESWDNKWKGMAKIHDGYWVCELAIPFSTLRFKENVKEWKFNSYRMDTQSNTRSSWHHIPQNQLIMSLAYMGVMEWEEAPKKSSSSIAVIPYISGGVSKNYEERLPSDGDFSIGGDAKIGLTPSMNLDLTVNPDFSQVEVDQQVLNLERFEVFFPERRQFFLENADLFGSFGEERINPFFSRRIGSAKVLDEEGEEISIQNPIIYGARLSGKLDRNWRAGLLNMQTAKDEEYDLPSYNYTVAAVQRKLFSRSNIGMIFVNKQTMSESDNEEFFHPYNRVIGLDYNLASSDNKWVGKSYVHRSFSPGDNDKAFAHGFTMEHRQRKYSFIWAHQYVGDDYNAEVGFIRRTNYFQVLPEAQMYFYPRSGPFNTHGPGMEMEMLWTPNYGHTDHKIGLYWDAKLRNTGDLRLTLRNEYTYLLEDFDPSRTDAEPLSALTGYNYSSVNLMYKSDARKKLAWDGEFTVGEFFNGRRYQVEGALTYRYQPYGFIKFDISYSRLNLPTVQTDLLLIGPRIDLTFTKNIFLTTFLQYNSQVDNFNINTRFQWRFAPVSDFFLVYTDNYVANNFTIKNRALVAKWTYWLNI